MIDRDRLAKLLGMCGSHHEGERANAARMASDMVCEAGLTWPQVLASADDEIALLRAENKTLRRDNEHLQRAARDAIERAMTPRPAEHIKATAEGAQRAAEDLLRYQGCLTAWEFDFLQSLFRLRGDPSQPQMRSLRGITRKVRALLHQSRVLRNQDLAEWGPT